MVRSSNSSTTYHRVADIISDVTSARRFLSFIKFKLSDVFENIWIEHLIGDVINAILQSDPILGRVRSKRRDARFTYRQLRELILEISDLLWSLTKITVPSWSWRICCKYCFSCHVTNRLSRDYCLQLKEGTQKRRNSFCNYAIFGFVFCQCFIALLSSSLMFHSSANWFFVTLLFVKVALILDDVTASSWFACLIGV